MSQFRTSTRKGSANLQTMKLPSIDLYSTKKVVTFREQNVEDRSVVEIGKKLMKRRSFVQHDEKKKQDNDQDDSPYRWIEEDTIYMRQYGHHLMDKYDDDDHHHHNASQRERSEGSNQAELGEDLWGGEYRSPCYKHIPGGYVKLKPSSCSSSESSGPCSLVCVSLPSHMHAVHLHTSSSHPSLTRKEEGYGDMRRPSVSAPQKREEGYGDMQRPSITAPQRKNFLPPIDPHTISVKKYGMV